MPVRSNILIGIENVEECYIEEHPTHILLEQMFKQPVEEDRVTCIFSVSHPRLAELIKK